MAIKVNFNGVSILKPGAYSLLNTSLLTESPLGDSGIVGIIGEADGGEPGVLDVLSQSQIQAAKARYKSGPIAKALDLLAQPSNDPRIPNGASRIIVYKTNDSTQSSKDLDNDFTSPSALLSLVSQNYGTDENNINIKVTEGSVEDSNAAFTGSVAGPFTLAGSDTLVINYGGAQYTFTSTIGSGSKTATEVVDELNTSGSWAPSKPIVAEKVVSGSSEYVKISLDDLSDAARLEYGIMSVDGTSTLDTLLGLTADTFVRGVKGSRIVIVNKADTTDTLPDLGGEALMTVQYTGTGTACVLAVQDVSGVKRLQTTVSGGPGSEDLDIDISEITLDQLVNQINSSSVYTAASTYFNKVAAVAGDVLDYYLSLDIDTMAGTLYGTVIAVFQELSDNSQFVTPTLASNVEGQLAVVSTASYFAGGTRGSSANSDFQDGFDAMKSVRANIVVPLVSKDATSPSTYTVDSVNAQADAHCAYMASTLGKSERNCYVSKHGTKTEVKAAARAINSRHTSMVAQQPTVLNELGTLEVMEEYAMACICAGMQAGSEVGEPITYKAIRVSALTQDASWEPRIDYDEMIEAGVLFAEQTDAGSFRVVVGNTTYSQDSNIVFNRISINEAGNYVAFELRTHLEALFTGTKARTGSATAIKNAAIAKLKQLRDEDIIVDGNEDDGTVIPAYRDLQVTISGVTATLDVTITPVPGIDFVLSTIYLTSLQASASA